MLAIVPSLAFVAFTCWWLIDGGAGLDALVRRLGDWLVRGLIDVAVGDSWVLGEPALAVAVVAVVVVSLGSRRKYRSAALVIGSFLLLSAVQLSVFLAVAEIHRTRVSIDAISHFYPSGHAARPPFLGTLLAVTTGSGARGWVIAGTAVVSVAVALDRTSSGSQTGSVVIGGLLMGIAASMWFAVSYSACNRTLADSANSFD